MRLGSNLWRALAVGVMAVAPLPAWALPTQQVWDDAGLGPMANWTLITDSTAPWTASLWGIGGNGHFALGGDVEIVLKSAAWDHAFGTVALDGSPCCTGGVMVITDRSGNGTASWTPSVGPFAFSLLNLTGHLGGDYITSEGFSSDARLDLAIYRSALDPSRFAFFFDDGGGARGDDNDQNDLALVVTERAILPEPGSLTLLSLGVAAMALVRRRRAGN